MSNETVKRVIKVMVRYGNESESDTELSIAEQDWWFYVRQSKIE